MTLIKRTTSIIGIFCLIALLVTSVQAAENGVLYVTNASDVEPDSSSTVRIYLDNAFEPPCGAAQFKLYYSDSIIQANSVSVTTGGVVPKNLQSPITFAFATTSGIPIGDAWLANITFKALNTDGSTSELGLVLEELNDIAIPPKSLKSTCRVQNGTFSTKATPATIEHILYVTNVSDIVSGSSATVGVYLDNSFAPPVGAAQFKLYYNNSIIQADSVSVTTGGVVPKNLQSPITFAFATTSGIPNGDAWLANITFKALNTDGSTSELGLTLEELNDIAIPPKSLTSTCRIQNGTFSTRNVPVLPVANFTANVTAGTAPLAVRFTDISTGDPTSWLWSFGDGATSTDRNPIHTYTAPGNYTVNLTVANSDAEGTVTKEHYIRVQQPLPRAELIFNVNYNRGTENDTITSGRSSCTLGYLTGVYNLPDNRESISDNLSFILDAPGIVSIVPEGYAEINGTGVTWTFPPSTAIDPDTTLSTFAATSVSTDRTSGVTLERSYNRTVFTEAGVQKVTLNITFDTVDLDHILGRIECRNTTELDLRTTIVPGTISTDLPLRGISQGDAMIHFTVNSSAVEVNRRYSFSCVVAVEPLRPVAFAPACAVWEVGNSTSVAAPAGTFVSLPAELLPQSVNSARFSSNTACEWTCTQNDHIITSLHQRAAPVSTPVTNFTANTTAGPAPLTVRFTDTSTGNPTSWNWSFGDGATSTEQNPIHTYTAPGNYTVNLTVSSASGSAALSRPGYITVTRVKGDFNGDGAVDIGDVSKVAYMVVGKEATDPGADFNENGKVDIGDAAKIAYYFVGKIPAL